MNEQTNKSPPVFDRTSSPLGPLPKKDERKKENKAGYTAMQSRTVRQEQ